MQSRDSRIPSWWALPEILILICGLCIYFLSSTPLANVFLEGGVCVFSVLCHQCLGQSWRVVWAQSTLASWLASWLLSRTHRYWASPKLLAEQRSRITRGWGFASLLTACRWSSPGLPIRKEYVAKGRGRWSRSGNHPMRHRRQRDGAWAGRWCQKMGLKDDA